MPNKTTNKFPSIPELPKPGWVTEMTPAARRKYDKDRAAMIKTDHEAIIGLARKLEGFEPVSDETLSYFALHLATVMADGFEEGLQSGIKSEQDLRRRRGSGHNSDARFRMAAISAGYGGMG